MNSRIFNKFGEKLLYKCGRNSQARCRLRWSHDCLSFDYLVVIIVAMVAISNYW